MTINKTIVEVLRKLALRDKSPTSLLAEAFIPVATNDKYDDSLLSKEVTERLFALITRYAVEDKAVEDIIKALVEIDEVLSTIPGVKLPFACRFAATAAAVMVNVDRKLQEEKLNLLTGKNSPVFELSGNLLCAVLSRDAGIEGNAIFVDRLLSAVMKKKPSKVILVMPVKPDNEKRIMELVESLCSDLTEQGIKVSVCR